MNAHLENIVLSHSRASGYYFVDFVSKKRTKHLVTQRHECWFELIIHGFSPEEIAEVFSADPSAIRYVINKERRKRLYDAIRQKKSPKSASDPNRHPVQNRIRR